MPFRLPAPLSARTHRWGGSRLGRLARRPWFYWLVAAALSLTTAWLASDLVADAQRAREQWGDQRQVLVARRMIEPGQTLTPADVEPRQLPIAAVPPGAVETLAPDATTVSAILPGEVVLAPRLSGSGEAALIPAGTAAVAVAAGAGSPPLEPGDRVQLWATLDPFAVGGDAAREPVARHAVVLQVSDGHALVAVDDADLAATTLALAQGALTVVLTGR